MKNEKNTKSMKPALEWAKTALILLTLGFVGGYIVRDSQVKEVQAKIDQAVKTATASNVQAVSKVPSR